MVLDGLFILRPGPRVVQKMRSPTVNFEGLKKVLIRAQAANSEQLRPSPFDHLYLTGIQRVSALASLVKAEAPKHHPPPLWPGLGEILGTSDVSVKN